MNVDQILKKAFRGPLNTEENSFLAKASKNPRKGELYKILIVFGEAQAVEYKSLVEEFLT